MRPSGTRPIWKQARDLCPTLSQGAVYEFLDGRRRIGLEYVEALMAATQLVVTRARRPRTESTEPTGEVVGRGSRPPAGPGA